MKLNTNMLLMLLGVLIAYYLYSTTQKNTTSVGKQLVESEEIIESEDELADEYKIKEDETEVLTDESNYDTEKFLDDNLLDDVDLHNNNEEDFLNNIEQLLEKEDALNNMLENEDHLSEKKNVEDYSIEFKDDSGHQDELTKIENNAPVKHNELEHNDNWENNSLMFRDMLNQDDNKVEIAHHKEEHIEVPTVQVKPQSNIQTNEITGYTDDSYYSLQ